MAAAAAFDAAAAAALPAATCGIGDSATSAVGTTVVVASLVPVVDSIVVPDSVVPDDGFDAVASSLPASSRWLLPPLVDLVTGMASAFLRYSARNGPKCTARPARIWQWTVSLRRARRTVFQTGCWVAK